uniref:Variable lymphocyte receptor A cassette n=1 Tax=Petromyzon marinus TaxID=7757 RepID=S4S0B4_PETMA
YNQLTSIPGKAFHGLTRLTYLELSNNKLPSLPVW